MGHATTPVHVVTSAEAKARQSIKLRELKIALTSAGFRTLDEQARALGLCRSTTWTILGGNHKASGLSATIINRMLSSPELPALVRTKVIEYIAEKAVGRYGHKRTQARRFFLHVEMGVDVREDLRSALRTNCERSGTTREGQSGSLGDSHEWNLSDYRAIIDQDPVLAENLRDGSWAGCKQEYAGLGGSTLVAMVQTANLGEGNNIAGRRRLYGTMPRAVLAERKMRSGGMVVLKIAR
jgi:hypothetical protein